MKKRITAIIMAVMLLSGCNNKPEPESGVSASESSASTPKSSVSAPKPNESKPEPVSSASASLQSYYDELQNCYKEYVSGTSANILTPEGAKAYVETRALGLEKFEKLVPPEKYAALHSEMLNFADAEREWNKVMLDYANGVIDTDQMTSKSQQIYGSTTVKSEFTTKCLGIITALNKEPEVTASDFGKFLQILYELSP